MGSDGFRQWFLTVPMGPSSQNQGKWQGHLVVPCGSAVVPDGSAGFRQPKSWEIQSPGFVTLVSHLSDTDKCETQRNERLGALRRPHSQYTGEVVDKKRVYDVLRKHCKDPDRAQTSFSTRLP